MHERDGATVGGVERLARVPSSGGGQQSRSRVELVDVILPRVGRTGPVRPAETKGGAIGAQISALRTVEVAEAHDACGHGPASARASHSRIASTDERSGSSSGAPRSMAFTNAKLAWTSSVAPSRGPSAARGASPPAPCGENPSTHARRATACSPVARQRSRGWSRLRSRRAPREDPTELGARSRDGYAHGLGSASKRRIGRDRVCRIAGCRCPCGEREPLECTNVIHANPRGACQSVASTIACAQIPVARGPAVPARIGDRRGDHERQFDAPPEEVWQTMMFYEEVPHRPPLLLRMFLPTPLKTQGNGKRVGARSNARTASGSLRKRITVLERPRSCASK